MMEDDTAKYILIGGEYHTHINYAVPVKNLLYDTLQYGQQVKTLATLHRANHETTDSPEFCPVSLRRID